MIIKNFPIGIKDQIKRQIKTRIREGYMKPGDMLLSAKDMGLYLNINRNTAALVYKELEQEGFLEIIKGSGTFVKPTTPQKNRVKLKQIFDQAYQKAVQSGFSKDKINDFFISELLEKSKTIQKGGRILLIDCNYEVLQTLDNRIKAHCDIESHLMLIQDIENFPEKFVKRAKSYDLALCGMNHLEDLKKAVPHMPVETVGFLIKTDFHIMNQIMQLPAGTVVGYCCVSEKSAQAFFNTTFFSSNSSLNRVHVGISDKKGIEQMFNTCDVIFATHYVYERLINTFPSEKKIFCVDLDIDPASFDFILSKIEKIRIL